MKVLKFIKDDKKVFETLITIAYNFLVKVYKYLWEGGGVLNFNSKLLYEHFTQVFFATK